MMTTDETYTKATALMSIWTLEANAKGLTTPLDLITYIQDRTEEIEDTDIDTAIFIGKVTLRYIVKNGL
jgi:hypothetical protein